MAAIRKILLPLLEKIVDCLLSIPYLGYLVDICLSYGASISRLFMGYAPAKNLETCDRPKSPLILYEFEGCPFCRRVREALSILRVDVIVYPCPRTTMAAYGVQESSRYRPEATKLTGKCIFPILVDPNQSDSTNRNGKVIMDSAVIVEYLWLTYGKTANKPWNYSILGKSIPLLLSIPSLYRILPRMGIMKVSHVDTIIPSQLLQLISYDGCPYSRIIREYLDSHEIPYLLKHSLLDSNTSTPVLIDVNVKKTLTNVNAILHHIQSTYTKVSLTTTDSNTNSWSSYSTTGATNENGVLGNDTVQFKQ